MPVDAARSPSSTKEEATIPKWALPASAALGGAVLLFLMLVVLLEMSGWQPPENAAELFPALIAFGLAIATGFIGGTAAAKGQFGGTWGKLFPVRFAVSGGIATFVVTFAFTSAYFSSTASDNSVALRSLVQSTGTNEVIRERAFIRLRDILGERDFRRYNLTSLNLPSSGWTSCDFTEAVMDGVSFRDADLRGVTFVRARLRNANFDGATFDDPSVDQENQLDFNGAILEEASFRGAILDRTWLRNGKLSHADFRNAHLREADLEMVQADYAVFDDADLRNATFSDPTTPSDISHASFRHADLQGADFSNVIGFATANFSGAIYDKKTSFPPQYRFTPKAHGMILNY